MKRFYIVSTLDGSVYWTNDEKYATESATSEDLFVVDTTTNEWLLSDGTRIEIPEAGV